MAHINRSVVTLRIRGEMLIPSEITAMLGSESSFEQRKGQVLTNKKGTRERIAKFGMWALETFDCEPENIEVQVFKIFDKLTNDTKIWNYLSNSFEVELFCGIIMKYKNEGMEISPKVLKILGERGIALSLDIYGGEDE